MEALATVFEHEHGLDPTAARVRGAQVVAFSLGWRIFERYLISWGSVKTIERQQLHDEVTAMARRIGATAWPPPRDPARRKPRSRKLAPAGAIGRVEHRYQEPFSRTTATSLTMCADE